MWPSKRILIAGVGAGIVLLGLNFLVWRQSTTDWRLQAASQALQADRFDRAIDLYERALRKERLRRFSRLTDQLPLGTTLPTASIEKATFERLIEAKVAKVSHLLANVSANGRDQEHRGQEGLRILEGLKARLRAEAPRVGPFRPSLIFDIRELKARANLLLGLAALSRRSWDQGLDYLDEAAALSRARASDVVRLLGQQVAGPPYDADVAFHLARAYRYLGNLPEARLQLERTVALVRYHLPALRELEALDAGAERDGHKETPLDEQLRALSPSVPVKAPLGDGWVLLGYDVSATRLRPGEQMSLTVYFQAQQSVRAGQEYGAYLTIEAVRGRKRNWNQVVLLKGVIGRFARAEGVSRGEVVKLTKRMTIPSHPRDLIIAGEVQPYNVVKRTPVPPGPYSLILWFQRLTERGSRIGLKHVTLPGRLAVEAPAGLPILSGAALSSVKGKSSKNRGTMRKRGDKENARER